jgi:predicted DNA binding CopG/RHH family protein
MDMSKHNSKTQVKDDLDQVEREMLNDAESGQFKSVENLDEEMQIAKTAAHNYTKRDSRINIRISGMDLDKIREIAEQEGIPYQTLVASIIHKYVNGRLIDKGSRT